MSSNMEIESRVREAPTEPPAVNNDTDHAAFANAGYASHSPSPANGQGEGRASPVSAVHSLPHGYNHAPPTQSESQIHPELRSSHEPPPSSSYAPVPTMMPATVPPQPEQPGTMSGPNAAVGGQVMGIAAGSDSGADGRKAKRELSQSKRAAQNRAAQRAFRQRKEGYIKKLEQQVREFTDMESSFKNVQHENYALREYIVLLQSRLLETQGDFPHPPAGLSLPHPHHAPQPPPPQQQQQPPQPQQPQQVPNAPEPVQALPAVNAAPPSGDHSLEVAAQAVAGLSRSEHLVGREHFNTGKVYEQQQQAGRADDDARTAEEITRQLQADGATAPENLPAAPM